MTNIRPAEINRGLTPLVTVCDLGGWSTPKNDKNSSKKSVCQIHLKDIVCFGPVFICSGDGGKRSQDGLHFDSKTRTVCKLMND